MVKVIKPISATDLSGANSKTGKTGAEAMAEAKAKYAMAEVTPEVKAMIGGSEGLNNFSTLAASASEQLQKHKEMVLDMERERTKLRQEIDQQRKEIARLNKVKADKASKAEAKAAAKKSSAASAKVGGALVTAPTSSQPQMQSQGFAYTQQPGTYHPGQMAYAQQPNAAHYMPMAAPGYYAAPPPNNYQQPGMMQGGWHGQPGVPPNYPGYPPQGYVQAPFQGASSSSSTYTNNQQVATKTEPGAKRAKTSEYPNNRNNYSPVAPPHMPPVQGQMGYPIQSGPSPGPNGFKIMPGLPVVSRKGSNEIMYNGKYLQLTEHGYMINGKFVLAYTTTREGEQAKKERKLSKAEVHRLHYVNSIKAAPEGQSKSEVSADSASVQKRNKRKRPEDKNDIKQSYFKGVSWDKIMRAWRTKINSVHIGYFDAEEDAARAYDEAALALRGKKRIQTLNYPRENYSDDKQSEQWMKYETKRNVVSRGTSMYRGVLWDKVSNNWRAKIKAFGKTKYLGIFADELAAARAYDAAAIAMHGENARLNFPEEHPSHIQKVESITAQHLKEVDQGPEASENTATTHNSATTKKKRKGSSHGTVLGDADLHARQELWTLVRRVRRKNDNDQKKLKEPQSDPPSPETVVENFAIDAIVELSGPAKSK